MAGHSKWANTKHRKTIQDTKRGRMFTKVIRELVIASRLGGRDPDSNPRLRTAIDKALSNNMTRETLNRAIARGAGNNNNVNMEDFIYEGYGPGGTAMIVECFSNNRNRTVAEVRCAFSKYGGSLSADGSVTHLFSKKGIISFKDDDEDIIIEAALKAGAEDISICDDGTINVYTSWKEVNKVRSVLEETGLKITASIISMIPIIKTEVNSETASKLIHLIDILEDCDDVQGVYHNGNISNEITMIL